MLDAVIDSGGGDILGQISNYLKQGGKVVCYGMYAQLSIHTHCITQNVTFYVCFRTASPKITFTMREVLRNQQLLGALLTRTAFHLISNTTRSP